MSSLALAFEDVSKKYYSADRGRKESNGFLQRLLNKNDKKAFYALQHINCQIHQGEVWGIIGNNGAGKSTMLKLAARILKPTSGVVRGYGKVTGILEVGAGFNYELTGRENIYLSGYILGMKKADITRLLDDIVSFAGIGEFLDTPIKRYSTGMYLRLAFAVAAFLRSNILVVDEVLAVGDIEFQQLCLNRITDTAHNHGTTVLFVSHNMFAVEQICEHAIWIDKGLQKMTGKVHDVVHAYTHVHRQNIYHQEWPHLEEAPGNEHVKIGAISLKPHLADPAALPDVRTPFTFSTRFFSYRDDIDINIGVHLFAANGEMIFDAPSPHIRAHHGWIEASCEIPGNLLNDGRYTISLIIVKNLSGELFYLRNALSFEIADYRENTVWVDKWRGAVRPMLPFNIRYA